MNDTILREEPIHWVQSPSQTAEASSVGAWSTEAVVALFDQPFTELLFRARTVHCEHFDPTEVGCIWHTYESVNEARTGIGRYIEFYTPAGHTQACRPARPTWCTSTRRHGLRPRQPDPARSN
jgi:hypothetical protein